MVKLRFDPATTLRYRDTLEVPNYGIPEVARYLRMPVATLRSWVLGRDYPTGKGKKRFQPLIELADPASHLLSFVNLAEAHVLCACRRFHQIRMDKIRAAIDYVAKELGSAHPLVDCQFETNGISLFVGRYGELVDVSAQGQAVIRELIEQYLERLERADGRVARLYPFTRPAIGAENPRSVFIDPRVSFGRPTLATVHVATAAIAERYFAGESVDHLAEDYGCEKLDVEEAIRCELRPLDAAA
ncbi:MAG TPA: DUF433 domain-containing protein [Pirellulales bacterium]|nr:DUF433 domain-containing protein [Pirellulales bacterium]